MPEFELFSVRGFLLVFFLSVLFHLSLLIFSLVSKRSDMKVSYLIGDDILLSIGLLFLLMYELSDRQSPNYLYFGCIVAGIWSIRQIVRGMQKQKNDDPLGIRHIFPKKK